MTFLLRFYAWLVQGDRCWHTFRGGMGLCGDALTCTECDHSKYPEVLSSWDKLMVAVNGVTE